ncbi:MAG: M48 family metallopeptidase [Deltaproteobacteria bacterium]|nr:M48 family metallopeptidase [Deltaproteobacteria bacterium]
MKNKPEMHTLQFGSRRIGFSLHHSNRKTLRIVVSPELTVDVFAPVNSNDEEIHSAMKKKSSWIAGKLDEAETYHPLPSPKRYVSGETLVYLGRQYRLKLMQGEKQPAKLKGRYLRMQVPDKKDAQSVKKAVDTWYRMRAAHTLDLYLQRCRTITSRHGVPEPLIAIRSMRKRWGSCSPKGRITLNIKLIQVPVHCIEYVIMHELCHLKHHNHSKAFYSLLTRCQPDWRKRKAALDRVRLS